MDNEIIKAESNSEEIYTSIRSFVITAQNKVYSAVNTAMVIAYWEIGEQIYKACGEKNDAVVNILCPRAITKYSLQSILPIFRLRKN